MPDLEPLPMLKVLLVGPNSPGKSTLMNSFVAEEYRPSASQTIGVDFHVKGHPPVKLQLWDSASQERFLGITDAYYRGVDIVIVCFSSQDKAHLGDLKTFLDRVMNKSMARSNIYLALTTSPPLGEPENITDFDIQRLLADYPRVLGHYRVSAERYEGVDEMFDEVVQHKINPPKADVGDLEGVNINSIDDLQGYISARYDINDEEKHDDIVRCIGEHVNKLLNTPDSLDQLVALYDAIGIGREGKAGDNKYFARLRQREGRWTGLRYRETNDTELVAKYCRAKAKEIYLNTHGEIPEHISIQYEKIFCTKTKRSDYYRVDLWFSGEDDAWAKFYHDNIDRKGEAVQLVP